ncbi:MAG: hypothetical protein Q4A32_11445 [Lachnospiraceae bacterium]|nr:hypothetical protein [Lachnospiraceae bacterium]
MSQKNIGNRFNSTSRQMRRTAPKGRASQKTIAIVSVCAIILGVMITAHDYLEKHTVATAAALAALTESMEGVAAAAPAFAEAAASADKSLAAEAEEMTRAAENLASGNTASENSASKIPAAENPASETLSGQSEAFLAITSAFEKMNASKKAASQSEAKALSEALEAAEDAAVAYNKEAQALNEKVGKFPYIIISKIAGYAEYPIFNLTREN